MTPHSLDVKYAYAQLGLAFGASLEEIGAVLVHARSYKYSTRPRIAQVERLVQFFAARDQLGDIETPFTLIRRAYHKKAMTLHPDRNKGDKAAEETLKSINIAFALVDTIHREARDYYRQSETARLEQEEEARAATERERPLEAKKKSTEQAKPKAETNHTARQGKRQDTSSMAGKKYFAASIPRYIRVARLSYVPVGCIIASWHIAQKNDVNFIYDVVMLPEREFLRARMHLSTPDVATPTLQRGGFSPAYMPKDIKSVTVPEGEVDPERYAKEHLLEEFRAEGKGG